MTEKEQAIVIDEKPNFYAGLSLKQAREAKKLSVSEVASELRLTRGTIESLESQQWHNLHGRPYARGYFLNYVRFLGLNESQMMAAFDGEYSIEGNQQKLSHTVPETKSVPWVGIICILGAVLITWFAYQHWQKTKTTELNHNLIESQPEETASDEQFDSFNSSFLEPREQDNSEPEELVLIDANPVEEKQTAQAIEEVSNNVEAPIETVLQQVEEVELVTNHTNITEASLGDEHQAELTFTAVKDCWVEVTDAHQKVLYYDLVKADNTVKLVGIAPVKVVLGNANHIYVTVNGNEFDTSSFVHGDVARFTVGVES